MSVGTLAEQGRWRHTPPVGVAAIAVAGVQEVGCDGCGAAMEGRALKGGGVRFFVRRIRRGESLGIGYAQARLAHAAQDVEIHFAAHSLRGHDVVDVADQLELQRPVGELGE